MGCINIETQGNIITITDFHVLINSRTPTIATCITAVLHGPAQIGSPTGFPLKTKNQKKPPFFSHLHLLSSFSLSNFFSFWKLISPHFLFLIVLVIFIVFYHFSNDEISKVNPHCGIICTYFLNIFIEEFFGVINCGFDLIYL